MDIASFILGLQKGKSMGGTDGGSGEWIGASGSFDPSSSSAIIEHNLGVVPDIFILKLDAAGTISSENGILMTVLAMSEKLLGADMLSHGVGYEVLYNPSNGVVLQFGVTGGLENMKPEGAAAFGNATSSTIYLGRPDIGAGLLVGGHYMWSAFARV